MAVVTGFDGEIEELWERMRPFAVTRVDVLARAVTAADLDRLDDQVVAPLLQAAARVGSLPSVLRRARIPGDRLGGGLHGVVDPGRGRGCLLAGHQM